MKDFVHLHVHSDYSFQDGVTKVSDLIAKAKQSNQSALALTDHGYLHGVIDFYQEANAAGIKPIIGVEAYLVQSNAYEKDWSQGDHNHITILAKNKQGYHNLLKLITIASTDCFHYKPTIDKALLKQYAEGLICLSGCLQGEINTHLYDSESKGYKVNIETARAKILEYQDIFKDDFYIELMYHGIKAQKQQVENCFKLINDMNLKAVITNDAHYANKKDGVLRDVVMADKTGHCLHDPARTLRDTENEFYLKTREELEIIWSGKEQYLDTTLEINDKIERFDPGLNDAYRLPKLKLSIDCTQYFKDKAIDGFKKLYPNKDNQSPEYQRLVHECKVIQQLGFIDYFLILNDLVEYAEKNSIPIGPGRGSAAGSIVSYCLNITCLDPIKYGLLFERFLNSGRKSLPDIDIDVCKEKRPQLIQYVKDKYGEDSVAQIITFGRMKGKGSLRNLGKVMSIPEEKIEELSKAMPPDAQEFTISLKQIANHDKDAPERAVQAIDNFIEESDTNKEFIKVCTELEGNYRSSGVHAAGIVIGPEPLKNIIPLAKAKDGGVVTQYSMEEIEALKLVKFDLLGLDTLTMVNNCIELIHKCSKGPIVENNIKTFRELVHYLGNFDDPNVYKKVFSKGNTLGIFQSDSSGIRSIYSCISCNNFEDISAVISLYRPGPLDSGITDSFIKRRNKLEKEDIWHECIREYVTHTHGLPIYQEQIMFISQALCGFSLTEADDLRKVIGKKKKDDIAKFRAKFVPAAVKHRNISEALANSIYDDLEKFGRYGFNKCLLGTTKVKTRRGEQAIKDITNTDQVLTVEESTGKIVWSNVVNTFNQGPKNVVRATFDDGTIVECTMDHKFLTILGQQTLEKIKRLDLPVWGAREKTSRNVQSFQNLFNTSRSKKESSIYQRTKQLTLCQQGTAKIKRRKLSKMASTENRCYRKGCKIIKSQSFKVRKYEKTESKSGIFKSFQKSIKSSSQDNFCSSRNYSFEEQKAERMERKQPRSLSKNNKEDDWFFQKIKTRNIFRTNPNKFRIQKKYQTLVWKNSKICGLHTRRQQDSYRDRWSASFFTNLRRRISIKNTSQRQIIRSRSNKAWLESNKNRYKAIQQQRNTKIRYPSIIGSNNESESWIMAERRLVSITELGSFETYDIEVDHKDHNFILSNGLCTSNSHSAAYSVICYVTGWLKTYYPAEFLSSILNKFTAVKIDKNETTKTIKKKDDESFMIYIWEAITSGLKIDSPSITKSYPDFRPNNNVISFGLSAIKGIGTVINDLIELRDKEGGFKNFPHFISCCVRTKVNTKIVQELFDTGCIDLPISSEEFQKYIKGYHKTCRCMKKTNKVNPECKLCHGNGLSKTLRTIFDDTKDFLTRERTIEEYDAFYASFNLSNEIVNKTYIDNLKLYNL